MPKLYSNCCIKTPAGIIIGRCSQRKLDWYIKKNLGKLIDDKTLELNYEPKLKRAINEYDTTYKENICCVCGEHEEEELVKHHVIPQEFKKWFPSEKKVHRNQDVLVMCLDCNEDCYKQITEFKNELMNRYNVVYDKDLARIQVQVKKLKGSKIPQIAKDKIFAEVLTYLKKETVTDQDIIDMIETKECYNFTDCKTPVEHIVKRIVSEGKIDEFINEWRTNFVNKMKPEHLPIGWIETV